MLHTPVISIKNLSKKYSNGNTVLNDVSFDIYKGEAIGIVGKNGAGKSTLLKILSSVTKPSSGTATIMGEVSSVLGIGAGLHPDLTGRENLNMMGTLARISGTALTEAIDKVIAFSELESKIDLAVKTYSDGMYVRLMLSAFFTFPCDILLIDEVIAAGDAGFRAKCYRQFERMLKDGKTVVMVTHNMQDVLSICNRAIYLDKELIIESKDCHTVVNTYLKDVTTGLKDIDPKWIKHEDTSTNTHIDLQNSSFTSSIHTAHFRLLKASVYAKHKTPLDTISTDDEICLDFTYEKLQGEGAIELGIKLFTLNDVMLLADSYSYRKNYTIQNEAKGIVSTKGTLPAGFLNQGTYYVTLVMSHNKVNIGTWQNVLRFDVVQNEWRSKEPWGSLPALIFPHLHWDKTNI